MTDACHFRVAVYCFKKALLTIHAIALRFGSVDNPPVPIPRTDSLPVFSDNVLPSLLVHLGILDLSTSTPSLGLQSLFPEAGADDTVDRLLALAAAAPTDAPRVRMSIPKEGPILSAEQGFILRAAAIDACELIVETARSNLPDESLTGTDGTDLSWLRKITRPEVDAWLWSVAKDRVDYRALPRFAQRGTVYF